MTLNQSGTRVAGSYASGRRISGVADDRVSPLASGGQLQGDWTSTKDAGKFVFTMAADCRSFSGAWGRGGSSNDGETWLGQRFIFDGPPPPPTVETLTTGLRVPWSIGFAPDGRLLVTQQPCLLTTLIPAKAGYSVGTSTRVPDCVAVGDGLRGLALAPDFAQSGHLYLVYTYRRSDGSLLTRVSRFTERDGSLSEERVILGDAPGGEIHTAGRLKFGPDGKLYLATGDVLNRTLPQDPGSLGGKILRFNPDGTVPADNPTPGSYVYSLGHRNPQGLAWHPVTGDLWITDHGPSPTIAGEPFFCCHDEINRIVPGGNYGWPLSAGATSDPRFIGPALESGAGTWAPSGAAFVHGNGPLASWSGSFVYGTLLGQHLGRITFAGPGYATVQSSEELLVGAFGRMREVAQGPDGYLYLTTSNSDGRSGAQARPGDDRILRIIDLPSLEKRRSVVWEAYLETLAREPDPEGLDTWTYTPLPEDDLRSALQSSAEGQRVQLVRSVYMEVLGRDPVVGDPYGLRSWVDADLDPEGLLTAIGLSAEGQRMTAGRNLYLELLGRDPAYGDLHGARFWVDSGLPLDVIRQAILASEEYRQTHGG